MLLALVIQVTPPPPPPALVTPPPSPVPVGSPPAVPSATPVRPSITVSPALVDLHPLQSQSIAIKSGTGPYTLSLDQPLVTATIDQNARTIAIAASQQTGRATLTIYDSTGAFAQIPVRVALDAGIISPTLTLRVTGSPLDPQWLAQLVQKDVTAAVQLQPGAAVSVQPFTLPPPLAPGAAAAIPVNVHIAGGDRYFDVDGTQSVDLQNVAVDRFSPPLLLYDDDPEKLTQEGVLFRGQVSSSAPARLYYYHENTTGQRELGVVLSANVPSSVQLIDASAGPNIDVMSVGHAVSRDFLARKPLDEGIVVDIGPQSPYLAGRFVMNRLDGAAGSIGIRVLSGGPVTVTVVSTGPGGLSSGELTAALAQPQLPGDGHHRTGLFSLQNYADDTVAYTAPGPDAQLEYGAQTPPAAESPGDPVKTGHDYGEYGVIRTVNFQIDNPLDQPQTLYLYERPMGGAVRSSFLVDGALVQLGCARVSDRYQIGSPLVVPPQSSMQLPVQTMTDGGSSYPLELGLTATPPLAAVPPINAPDGCFPKPQASVPVPAPSATPASAPAPEPTGLLRSL